VQPGERKILVGTGKGSMLNRNRNRKRKVELLKLVEQRVRDSLEVN
jgi:hypothetical protein